jgi:hypothetical protein
MNDELSADELLVLVVSVLYAAIKGAAFYRDLFLAARLGRNLRLRLPLALAPVAGLAILLPVLLYLAEEDVRTSQLYILLFLALGAAWMLFATQFFPLLGLSIRENVVEQGNQPAAIATGGAMLGFLLAYAGGNIGSGPTFGPPSFPPSSRPPACSSSGSRWNSARWSPSPSPRNATPPRVGDWRASWWRLEQSWETPSPATGSPRLRPFAISSVWPGPSSA